MTTLYGGVVCNDAVSLRGDVTIAAGMKLEAAVGTGRVDFSRATGAFSTTTGVINILGDTLLAANKSFVVSSGTGSIDLSGATSVYVPEPTESDNAARLFDVTAGDAATLITAANNAASALTSTLTTSTLLVHRTGTETVSGNKTFSAPVSITDQTEPSDPSTGALVVSGGVGIGGVAYLTALATFSDSIIVSSTNTTGTLSRIIAYVSGTSESFTLSIPSGHIAIVVNTRTSGDVTVGGITLGAQTGGVFIGPVLLLRGASV